MKIYLDEEALARVNALRARLKAGLTIPEFLSSMSSYFLGVRTKSELRLYRLAKGPLKEIADEVSVVQQFLLSRQISAGTIRFSLNSDASDCWIGLPGKEERPFEVTIAGRRAEIFLARDTDEYLQRRGDGPLSTEDCRPGYLGLRDNAGTDAVFASTLAHGRMMLSASLVHSQICEWVMDALLRKALNTYPPDTTLLIRAKTYLLRENLDRRLNDLRGFALETSFSSVYLVSDSSDIDRPTIRLK